MDPNVSCLRFAFLAAAICCATACGDDVPAGGGNTGGSGGVPAGAGGEGAGATGGQPEGGTVNQGGQPQGGMLNQGGQQVGGMTNQGGMGGQGGNPPCAPTGDETCASTLDEDCDGTECGLWGHVYGTSGNSGAQAVIALQLAPNGDVYFVAQVGAAGDSIDFAGQTITADATHLYMLAKVSASGQELWSRPLPSDSTFYRILGANDDGVFIATHLGATIDLGGGPLVSDGWSDAAFAAFDNDGDYVWGTTLTAPGFGGTNFTASGPSPSGQIIIAGSADPGAVYEGEPIADPGSTADPTWYGLAIDANTGVKQWLHEWEISDFNNGVIRSIAFDAQGDIFLAGYSVPGTLNFGGPTLQVGPSPGGWSQGFVVHLDENGDWVDGDAFCDQCVPRRILIGPAGEIVMTGEVNFYQLGNIPTPPGGGLGFFRLDSTTFQPVWAKFMSEIPDIDINPNGDVGFSFGDDNINFDGMTFPDIGDTDLLVGKVSMSGALQWHRRFGAPGADLDDDLLQTYRAQPDGKGILFFRASGPPVDFGFGPMSFPGANIALVQIAP